MFLIKRRLNTCSCFFFCTRWQQSIWLFKEKAVEWEIGKQKLLQIQRHRMSRVNTSLVAKVQESEWKAAIRALL
jgi:hypothetical protein